MRRKGLLVVAACAVSDALRFGAVGGASSSRGALFATTAEAATAVGLAGAGAGDVSPLGALVGSCEAAARDKRLLDEVVARFGYSGTFRLECGGGGESRWDGQGAVKP